MGHNWIIVWNSWNYDGKDDGKAVLDWKRDWFPQQSLFLI